MDKKQFLNTLSKELKAIPQKDRDELLEDYQLHFTFGEQQGKSEQEIAQELGHPIDIAKEALEQYHRNSPPPKASKHLSRSILAGTGLFILNFILCLVPIGISIWAAWLGLTISSAVLILSPLVACLEFIVNMHFTEGLLFASIALCGFGILLLIGFYHIGKMLSNVTKAYYKWNIQVIKGDY